VGGKEREGTARRMKNSEQKGEKKNQKNQKPSEECEANDFFPKTWGGFRRQWEKEREGQCAPCGGEKRKKEGENTIKSKRRGKKRSWNKPKDKRLEPRCKREFNRGPALPSPQRKGREKIVVSGPLEKRSGKKKELELGGAP